MTKPTNCFTTAPSMTTTTPANGLAKTSIDVPTRTPTKISIPITTDYPTQTPTHIATPPTIEMVTLKKKKNRNKRAMGNIIRGSYNKINR